MAPVQYASCSGVNALTKAVRTLGCLSQLALSFHDPVGAMTLQPVGEEGTASPWTPPEQPGGAGEEDIVSLLQLKPNRSRDALQGKLPGGWQVNLPGTKLRGEINNIFSLHRYSVQGFASVSSFSRDFQDLSILPVLLNVTAGTSHPFFVESYAGEGEYGSNTLMYELLGWTGLLIEPVPELHALCHGKHRNVYTVQCALSNSLTWKYPVGIGRNGIIEPSSLVQVPAYTLADLMRDCAKTTVDFWSLRGMGGIEAQVLNVTDFSSVEVGVILVDSHNNTLTDAIKETMSRHGFRFLRGVYTSVAPDNDLLFVNPPYFVRRGLRVPKANFTNPYLTWPSPQRLKAAVNLDLRPWERKRMTGPLPTSDLSVLPRRIERRREAITQAMQRRQRRIAPGAQTTVEPEPRAHRVKERTL